jgi:N-acetylglucosamine-6-phosphate deacetylase
MAPMNISGLIVRPDGATVSGRVSFAASIEGIEARSSAGSDFILPGFIDVQVNGAHGINVPTASTDEIAALAKHLAREGTTGFLPTAVTAPLGEIEQTHSRVAEAMKLTADVERVARAQILGMHLEGPFICAARLGAHPNLTLEPSGEPLERVLAMDQLRLLTLAPELEGGLGAITRLVARAVAVSIGHSDATLEIAHQAVGAGATMFTHVFNATRPLHHREPGVIAAALAPSPAFAAVIADGVHVHPEILKLVYRSRGAGGMILTSDRVALAGVSPKETHPVGRTPATISKGAARLADGTIAGSIISMLDGFRLMVREVGVSPGEAAVMASTNPCRLLGLEGRGSLVVGARSDVVVLDRELKLKAVFIGGREVA